MGKFNALAKFLGLSAEKFGDDAAKVLEKVDNAELAVSLPMKERVQYLKALNEVYGNKNQRAKLSGKNLKRIKERNLTEKYMNEEGLIPREIPEFSSNEKRFVSMKGPYDDYSSDFSFHKSGNNDAELYPSHQGQGIYKKMIEDNALQTGETVSKFNQRNKFSKKTWDSLVNQGLAKRDEKLGFDKIVKEEIENKLNRLPNAAFDPRFKDSPLLMAGGLAGANIGDMNEMIPKGERYKRALDEELSMVPKEMLQKGLHWWEKQKEKVTKPLAESLLQNPSLANLPPEVQQKLQGPISPEALSKGLSAVFDPVNLISGPAGLAAGAAQMLTPSDEEMAKQEQEQAMRRKVLNQLAGQ